MVLVKLESPVGAHAERVQLEGELARIDVRRHVAGLLRVLDRRLERHQPLADHARDLVAHRARAPVELQRSGREETPAAENLALHVAEPGVGQREDLLNPAADAGRCDDLVEEDLARRLHSRDLQVDLRAEVREQAALADAQLLGEPSDREPLEALGGRDLDGVVEDGLARAVAPGAAAVGSLLEPFPQRHPWLAPQNSI